MSLEVIILISLNLFTSTKLGISRSFITHQEAPPICSPFRISNKYGENVSRETMQQIESLNEILGDVSRETP